MNPALARLRRLVAYRAQESDGCLLSSFLSGNQSAFRELVDRHGSLVFGVCNRILRHQQDAEDAFQAAFIVLARRAADVWPRDAVGSWLYGVATRVAFKARALRMRRQKQEESLASCCVKEVIKSNDSTIDSDTAEAIDRAVRKLPEVYRAAVVACDLEGLSRKEAAGRLGWTEGTLSGRLARARKLLAVRLSRAGITCPAVGFSAVLGTDAVVRAGLPEAVMRVVCATAEIPASLMALTQGVVHNMFALKLKAAAAAVLVVCTVGVGAWTARAGDDPGSKKSQWKATSPPMPIKEQRLDLSNFRSELNAIERELNDLLVESKAAGGNPSESLKRRIRLAEDKLAEFRRLMTEARGPEKPSTATFTAKIDPALIDLEGKWKIESIRDGKNVQKMDPKVEFVMEIEGNKLFMPYRESDGTVKRKEYKIAVDAEKNPKTINLIQPGKPGGSGIYEFSVSGTTCTVCHKAPYEATKQLPEGLVPCGPGRKRATGLSLAIATNGPQPTKFGGTEGVLEFQLTRVGFKQFHVLPLVFDNTESDMRRARLLEETLRLRQAQALEEEARAQLAKAQAQVAQAKADVEVARAEVEVAVRQLEDARARIAALEKFTAPAKLPAQAAGKDDASYTVHIRTQYAPEKVIRVKATGTQTVLEGLAYAAEDMAIKPEAISVWVIREKALLSVELAAITQNADPKTNYQLKPGDQLFVQVKVGK
jgi:RNA polymerase sigma factor (sigma-70 family)